MHLTTVRHTNCTAVRLRVLRDKWLIPVEEDGLYQVTVLGIRRGSGILQSDVEYEEMLMVNDAVTAGTITHSPEHIIINYTLSTNRIH